MKIDISRELSFRTARSGGKGGQNVNKVETMVEALFQVGGSRLLTEDQKQAILSKLGHKLNSEGCLTARSSATRSQLSNKEIAIDKINAMVNGALAKKKARISTRPTKASGEKRIRGKKTRAEVKEGRRKIKQGIWD
jgi:ribosome-associated protein